MEFSRCSSDRYLVHILIAVLETYLDSFLEQSIVKVVGTAEYKNIRQILLRSYVLTARALAQRNREAFMSANVCLVRPPLGGLGKFDYTRNYGESMAVHTSISCYALMHPSMMWLGWTKPKMRLRRSSSKSPTAITRSPAQFATATPLSLPKQQPPMWQMSRAKSLRSWSETRNGRRI